MQPFGLFEGSVCYCNPDITPKINDIVCIERIREDTVNIAIKKIGFESTEAYEIFGLKAISQNTVNETQEIYWEAVKKDEIQRISVVTLISLQPLLA